MSVLSPESNKERLPAVLHFFDFINRSSLPGSFKRSMEGARITKVEISSARKQWRVHLALNALVNRRHLDSLADRIADEVPELKELEFVLRYCMPDITLDQVITDYWEDIVYTTCKKYPSLSGCMASATRRLTGNNLQVIITNTVGWELINRRQLMSEISSVISTEFGLEVKASVLVQEEDECEIQEWAVRREEECARALAVQQASSAENGAGPDKKKDKPVEKGIQNGFRKRRSRETEKGSIKGRIITEEAVTIQQVVEEEKSITVQGRIVSLEVRQLKSGRNLIMFDLTDFTDSISVKIFEDEKEEGQVSEALKKGMWVKVRGPVQQDAFDKDRELVLMAWDVNVAEFEVRTDRAEEKRVELHLHTKMSAMDGVAGISEAIGLAAKWGHPAVAVTDHGVVQAFPDAYEAGKKLGIKVIYGMEGYLIDDGVPIVLRPRQGLLDQEEIVVFDLETTGFSPSVNEIIEIGAVKIKKGQVIDRFASFVRPGKNIPVEVQKLTGILPEMVADAPEIDQVLPEFLNFLGAATLAAHNAQFDAGFLRVNLARTGNPSLDNPVLDTLGLARGLLPKLKNHKLKKLAEEFGIPLENHHRAVDDAEATARILMKFCDMMQERGITSLEEVNSLSKDINLDKLRAHHVLILVRNFTGLRNLYELVTLSHLNYYYRNPRIPRSELVKRREGLIIGSACEAGELISAYLDGADHNKLEELAAFYDFLEIQPVGNNEFLVRQGRVDSEDALRKMNSDLVQIGAKLGKPVAATGDVHFLDPADGYYRKILMAGKGFEDAGNQAPLYFKTTEEMLEEFSYLGAEKAREVVLINPRKIADQIDDSLKPMPDDFFPPKIEGAEEQITSMTMETAIAIYGNPLPETVKKRVDKELNSIISNGFAVLYLIAHKLVRKSNEDGYLVGSRGSVGSSFVATMTGITEVNPLPPHYICPECTHSKFIEDGSYGCGVDLPDKDCPNCGTRYKKDGFDIPFEVFLGFEGDKTPDIDLNFSGDYQPRAHKFTEELFGEGHVFRAGTIGTIAEKTAYGFVKKYMEDQSLIKRKAEMNRLAGGCTGVKRTTGQHPGGVMIVPRDNDVHEFTPLQYPADDKKSGIITTHFDYHSISGRIVKLDILGHDDPTAIKMLEDLTGINARNIPLDEPKTMQLFSGTEVLGVTHEQIRSNVGTYAIPEFGTKFVRQMLEDTRPANFAGLVRISGFSHGTDVWLNNAQDLIRSNTCQLTEAISTRDDIMIYLIYKGLKPKQAFKIMEGVRKGKGVKPEDQAAMTENNVPEWYIDSCKKIKYMFPKAHAVAYVMMAYRIAYFKVYYPEAFYATYFTVRADEFDADIVVQGSSIIRQRIEEIENKGNDASAKEKNLLTILEVALEMYERGIKMLRINLEKSDAYRFQITDSGLLPPFAGLQGLGETAAKNIVRAREEKPFTSVEDLRQRAKLSKTVIEMMQKHGCLMGLPETDQLALF